MSRGRAGTVSKAPGRVVVPGLESAGEGSLAPYCSGGHRIPLLPDGAAHVLPGRDSNPLETLPFLEDGPAVDLLGFGSRECYGKEASASTSSIPTSTGWAGSPGTSRTGQGPLGDAPGSAPGAEGLRDQPAAAPLPGEEAPGHPCQKSETSNRPAAQLGARSSL